SQYWATPLPAVQPNVTDAPAKVEPGVGVVITAGAVLPPPQPSCCKARSTRMRGLVQPVPPRLSVIGVPELFSAFSIRSTVAVVHAERIAAKAPVTWGAAMDVPVM